MNRIQNHEEFKKELTMLMCYDPLPEEDAHRLYDRVWDYLSHTPSCKLIGLEGIIRELCGPYGEWGAILEEIGVAKAENTVYMNGVAWGDEPADDNLPF